MDTYSLAQFLGSFLGFSCVFLISHIFFYFRVRSMVKEEIAQQSSQPSSIIT